MSRIRSITVGTIIALFIATVGASYAAGRASKPEDPASDLVAVELALQAMQASGESMHERMQQAARDRCGAMDEATLRITADEGRVHSLVYDRIAATVDFLIRDA